MIRRVGSDTPTWFPPFVAEACLMVIRAAWARVIRSTYRESKLGYSEFESTGEQWL